MLRVWMDIHKDELMADWEVSKAGDEPFRTAEDLAVAGQDENNAFSGRGGSGPFCMVSM